jgi:hypothetical protein
MSSLLEQAIVDAKALKEAALKNAEQAIIEKYAPDIKQAVQKILEQDEPELEDEDTELPPEMLDDEMGLDAEEEQEPYIPQAATDGQRLCPCPEDEQEIVIDFDELRTAVMESENALGISDIMEDAKSDGIGVDAMDQTAEAAELAAESPQNENLEEEQQVEEEINISEELIDALLEKVVVDVDPNGLKSGHLERPVKEKEELEKLRLLALQDTERQEEFNKLNDTLKSLQEGNTRTEAKNESLKSNIKKLTETIDVLKEKFDEMAVSNSRLIYTNRILKDASLNERQKDKIVEALSKCDSIDEAKVIYETLQSAVSGKDKTAIPQSLREAIGRNTRSSTIIPTRRGSQTRELSFAERMQTLAGIEKK